MTDPRGVHSGHLDAATIAALVDRTLDPATRAAAEAHLAACADCREVWVETSEVVEEGQSLEARTEPMPHLRRLPKWLYGGAAIAASALVATITWSLFVGRDNVDGVINDLVDAVGTARFSVARVSVPFEHGTPPAATRGTGEATAPSLAVQRQVIRLQELQNAGRTADTLRGAGLGYLAIGDVAKAVMALEEASELAPELVSVDLSAALLERWRLTGDAHDVTRALHFAETAVLARPDDLAARFNLALALEGVGLRDRAIAAWQTYLEYESDDRWRREAESRLKALEEQDLPAGDQAVNSAGPITETASPCALKAEAASAAWRSMYEDSNLIGARTQAVRHRSALACDGRPTTEAEMQLGLVELQLGNTRVAKTLLQHALRDAESSAELEVAGRAGIGLGVLAFREGDIGAGTRYLKAALAPAEASGRPYLRALAHSMLADTYQEHGEPRATWTHQVAAVEAVRQVASPRWNYTILSGAALNARVAGLPGAALHFSETLMERTVDWVNVGGRIFAHLERAQARLALGLVDGASADIASGRALLPQLEEPLQSEFRAELAAAEGRVAGKRHPLLAARAFGEGLAIFERRKNTFRRAGLLLERGRALLASGDPHAAEADWREGIRLIEREQGSISERQLRVARLSHVWDLYDELIRLKVSDPSESLALLEDARARHDRPGDEIPWSGESREHPGQWLASDTVAYVYASLAEALLIWRITADDLTLTVRDISSSQLSRLIDAHVQQLDHEDAPAGIDLGEVLLPSGETAERFARTVIVADGPLHRLPFSTLRRRPERKRLVESTELTMAPSLRLARSLFKACTPDYRRDVLLAGYGAAAADEGLPPLPAVATELQRISRVHPDAATLIGPSATPRALVARIQKASLVHVAGHAVVDMARPSQSRILLASHSGNSGSLLARDIEGLRLQGRPLVVLPACATAAGRIFRGEGAVSLSTPFLVAGASAVVSTLWAIQDTNAEWIMTRFHEALRSGTHPAAALARVQRAAAVQMPARAWSAFVYYGSPSKGIDTCPI